LTAERLERAKAHGEIRADVPTSMLVALIAGPVLQTALRGAAGEIDDAWIAGLVAVVLDGARPRPQRRRPASGSRRSLHR
jgi:hypothetical protein